MTADEFRFELQVFLAKEVAMIRKTLPFKTGLLSGQTGSGGFHLEKTKNGYSIFIDTSKVFYANYVNDITWRSKKTGLPKKTANFWNLLVINRLKRDIVNFAKSIDKNATIG